MGETPNQIQLCSNYSHLCPRWPPLSFCPKLGHLHLAGFHTSAVLWHLVICPPDRLSLVSDTRPLPSPSCPSAVPSQVLQPTLPFFSEPLVLSSQPVVILSGMSHSLLLLLLNVRLLIQLQHICFLSNASVSLVRTHLSLFHAFACLHYTVTLSSMDVGMIVLILCIMLFGSCLLNKILLVWYKSINININESQQIGYYVLNLPSSTSHPSLEI